MANEFLKYTSKDYNSIKADLISAIPAITDLWTNTEDGDPGIVLVKLMSALGDMLSYNLDKQALEYYSSTVTQRKNAAKLFNLIGYKMHWYQSATNRIAVTNTIVTPYSYQAVNDYTAYKALANLTHRTPEQEEQMEQLREAYISKADQYVVPAYPQELYPTYYKIIPGSDPPAYGLDYDLMLGDEHSPLIADYAVWKTKNTLSIYTYICSPQKTLIVRNGNRSDTVYLIEPTIASNADSSNDYLGSTDDIEPGQTHEFNVIQGSLNSISFSPIRMRNNRYYLPEAPVDEVHMWLSWKGTNNNSYVNAESFIEKTDNLLTVTDGEIYFEFGVDDFDNPYIELPSYWVDKLGDSVEFTIYYIRSSGVYGNITKDFLNTIEGIHRGSYTITHPANTAPYINSNGEVIALPGQHPQTAHQAYIESLNYVTTFNTLVTIYDFERFVKRQPGFANAYAVDGQRANDLNTALTTEAYNLSLAQLQAYYHESRDPSGRPSTDDDETALRNFYIARKTVKYSEVMSKDYKPYNLNMHIVYGNFDIAMDYDDTNRPVQGSLVARMIKSANRFWMYTLISDYTVEYEKDEHGNYKVDDDGQLIPIQPNYTSIFDVDGNGRAAHYLDEKFRDTKIVNVCPEYASVRVFPWRCCGTIHLKYPVTKPVANKILETVMEHLSAAFHPANIEFGKKIKYMDIIDVVTSAHEAIAYFDAGLNSRQLIDVDQGVDMTYFNNTSLMYYVQSSYGRHISDVTDYSDWMYGNEEQYCVDNVTPNPYYHILSIAPEYIINNS